MKEAATWGSWEYDLIPGNETPSPDILLEYLDKAKADPKELKRQAYISLELATHPYLGDATRESFYAGTMTAYNTLLMNAKDYTDYTVMFTYAFLPLLGVTTKTELVKANREVRNRSRRYLDFLENGEYQVSPSTAIGKAAELLCVTALRQKGFKATPSHFRQDNSIPLIEGRQYRWDITGVKGDFGFDEDIPLKLQVKHQNYNEGSWNYHPDITVHQIFTSPDEFRRTSPRVFGMLHSALGIDAGADPAGYTKYIKRLDKDLQNA